MTKQFSPFILYFAISVFLNYLPDISPYYLSLFSHGNLKVIGALTQFAEPCNDPDSDGWSCRVQYRIPKSVLGNGETLGLGVILFSTELECSSDPKHKIVLEPKDAEGRLTNYLRTYQTISLGLIPCESDLLMKNWSKTFFNRYGYSQAPAVVGSQKWVIGTKRIVEQSITGLLFAAVFTFFIFFLILKTLQRITGTSLEFPPFDPFRFYWLSFIICASGFLFEILLPFSMPNQFVARITNFFGIVSVGGPTVLFIATENRAFPVLQRTAAALTLSKKYNLLPMCLVGLAIVSPANFRYIYPNAILLFGATGLIAAIRTRNKPMFFYSLCLISDGLKVAMVPWLPASRLTITYMLFVFAHGMRRQINVLEENARFEAGISVAVQIAHDIRSPLGALKNLVPLLSGEKAIKEIASEALEKIQTIADEYLNKFKVNRSHSGDFNTNLNELISETVRSKIIELGASKIIFEERIDPTILFVNVPPIILSRILSNILNNSIDAAKGNQGRIVVSLSSENKKAVISILDFGQGIRAEILSTILSRPFTTKAKDSLNTGVALYNAKKNISDWGGSLELRSSHSEYTEVRIVLPITNQ